MNAGRRNADRPVPLSEMSGLRWRILGAGAAAGPAQAGHHRRSRARRTARPAPTPAATSIARPAATASPVVRGLLGLFWTGVTAAAGDPAPPAAPGAVAGGTVAAVGSVAGGPGVNGVTTASCGSGGREGAAGAVDGAWPGVDAAGFAGSWTAAVFGAGAGLGGFGGFGAVDGVGDGAPRPWWPPLSGAGVVPTGPVDGDNDPGAVVVGAVVVVVAGAVVVVVAGAVVVVVAGAVVVVGPVVVVVGLVGVVFDGWAATAAPEA